MSVSINKSYVVNGEVKHTVLFSLDLETVIRMLFYLIVNDEQYNKLTTTEEKANNILTRFSSVRDVLNAVDIYMMKYGEWGPIDTFKVYDAEASLILAVLDDLLNKQGFELSTKDLT